MYKKSYGFYFFYLVLANGTKSILWNFYGDNLKYFD